METNIRITILADNTATRPDILAEHGLSLWIEYGTKKILWDTGQSDFLLANAKQLGIDLSKTDIIMLSHGHYDHTGGLRHVMAMTPQADIYAHPAVPAPRYSKKDSVRFIGMPPDTGQALQNKTVHWIESWTQAAYGIFLTGPIPRLNSFEDTGGAFFLDPDCRIEDTIADDQALVLESAKGLIAVLGCAHSGTVNTLDYITRKTGRREIHAVIGGMHLVNASRERLDRTVEAFRQYCVRLIIPLHCTGPNAVQFLQSAMSGNKIQLPQSPYLELK